MIKSGDKVKVNGQIGTVQEVLAWSDYKLANIKLDSGLICTTVKDLEIV